MTSLFFQYFSTPSCFIIAVLLGVVGLFVRIVSEVDHAGDTFFENLTRIMGPGVSHQVQPRKRWGYRTLYILALLFLMAGIYSWVRP